jgi:hypothetical protein
MFIFLACVAVRVLTCFCRTCFIARYELSSRRLVPIETRKLSYVGTPLVRTPSAKG